MKPRLLREVETRQDEQAITEFAALLLAALDIPEVQTALRHAVGNPPAAADYLRQRPPAPVRGRGTRRG